MQDNDGSTDPAGAAPTQPAAPLPPGLTTADVSSNGHLGADSGSLLYVQAWDAHAQGAHAGETRRQRQHNLRVAREIVETGILALVIFLGVRAIVQNFRVEGMSMDPTYATGQYVLVNKALYTRLDPAALSKWVPFWDADEEARYVFRPPHRGDVVVFEPPIPNRGDRDFIKRIIGEPGDHVVVKDGRVSVNGRQLHEQYIANGQTFCGGQYCDVTLGPDEYYVMGDNRANSSDSRLWGPVPGGSIVGKSWLIYLPFSDFGAAPNGAPEMGPSATGRRP
jgi:signal peptidase I